MVTDSTGNIEPYKTYSNSVIKNKYYTPLIHNTIFDGYYCTEDPRYAMYHNDVGELIIPYHYIISINKLLKYNTLHAPHYITITDTSILLNCSRPILRPINAPPRKYVNKHLPYRMIAPRYNWT